MRNEYYFGICLVLAAQLIAAISQVFLKVAAQKNYDIWWKFYLNYLVIAAYGMFFGTTIMNVFAMRYLPLARTAALAAIGQVLVPVCSAIFLKEKISKKKRIGMLVIIVGIIVFSI